MQYKNTSPDIVLMDIEMPEMNGIEALREILQINREARVIMCSSLTQKGTTMAFKALEQGAFDCLAKPTTTSIDRGDGFKNDLMRLLRQTKKFPLMRTPSIQDMAGEEIEHEAYDLIPYAPNFNGTLAQAVAIGSSTGGPAVLTEILKQLPILDIPIFITQHMPKGFTKILSETLSRNTKHTVVEAQDNMRVKGGNIYIAPGGQHMCLEKITTGMVIQLNDGPPVNFCKPSVNVMLESLLQNYKTNIVTAILTGMGDDGAKACKKLVEASESNIVITQDKTTSIVWGMPAAVADNGHAHGVFPMSNIAPAINRLIKGQRP